LDLIGKVKELLANELNLEAIADDAKQVDHPEWDSLTYLRIVAAVENEFGVQITPENINKFDSVQNIVKEIRMSHDNS
jgi:acyl carrier protein